MTEQEIEQAAIAYAENLGVSEMDFDLAVSDFIAGAKWMQNQLNPALID